jgi:hypothetical protein
VFLWLSERILFTEDRKGREDKPGRGDGSQRWHLFVIFVIFCEDGSLVFPWLSERILFAEDRKGREDKPGRKAMSR